MRARECSKAVILARGLGTRMRESEPGLELAADQSAAADLGLKAMIPIGRPFLDYVLSALGDAGFTDVCMVVAPDHAAMRAYYTRTAPPDRLRVTFAVQAAPSGTADAVLAAAEFTEGEPFVVLNADNYYPAEALARLRVTNGPATIGFAREGLVRGNIPVERIAAYALLDVDSDGMLRRVIEKPDATSFASLDRRLPVSMNVWRLTSEFFRACRDVQPSSRGEFELPLAVQYAIDVLGMRFTVIPVDAPVLDLSRRSDIPRVAAWLARVAVRL